MFFRHKAKNEKKLNKLNAKRKKIPYGGADFGEFDYEAIKFNEFLTDDVEYIQTKNKKEISSITASSQNDSCNSPLGARMAKDNQTMELINHMVKSQIDTHVHGLQSENIANKKIPTKNQHGFQTSKMSNDTKAYLQNQNTKVLITEDIENMMNDFNHVTKEAAAILNDPNNVTKPLSTTTEIKTPFTKEFMHSSHQAEMPTKLTDVKPTNKYEHTNTVVQPAAEIKRADAYEYRTKALFDKTDSSNSSNNQNALDEFVPVKKTKVLFRIRKADKREI